VLARQGQVGREVPAQLRAAALVGQQRERGEAGQVEPAVEDQRGLQAAVGEKRAGRVQLWEPIAMAHDTTMPEA
jgi:hypothetical protein